MHYVQVQELWKCSAKNFIVHEALKPKEAQYRATPEVSAGSRVRSKAALFNSVSL